MCHWLSKVALKGTHESNTCTCTQDHAHHAHCASALPTRTHALTHSRTHVLTRPTSRVGSSHAPGRSHHHVSTISHPRPAASPAAWSAGCSLADPSAGCRGSKAASRHRHRERGRRVSVGAEGRGQRTAQRGWELEWREEEIREGRRVHESIRSSYHSLMSSRLVKSGITNYS